MAGLVPAIHGFVEIEDVDARRKAGHDFQMPYFAGSVGDQSLIGEVFS